MMDVLAILLFVLFLGSLVGWRWVLRIFRGASRDQGPVSVNYHISRVCNYACSFCFHTAIGDLSHLEEEEAKRGLKLLAEAGMRKLNFAGGEPLLLAKLVGKLARYCKEELQLESVSIVTNGSKLKENWLADYGQYIDIIAISVDSFDEAVNVKIGRGTGEHLDGVRKLNTVVAAFNVEEDMTQHILELNPSRWKQVLAVDGENAGTNAKRTVEDDSITTEQFSAFLARHQAVKAMVSESNEQMRSSYLLLDEKMRFLDCSNGAKTPGQSILDVGVQAALGKAGWDSEMFSQRGGKYDWSKKAQCSSQDIEDCGTG